MKRNIRLTATFIFGILMAYVWSAFLSVGGAGQLLFAVYVMLGFIVSSCLYSSKMGMREYVYISAAFGVFAGIVDISMMAVGAPGLLGLALADMALKIGLSASGGLLFYAAESRLYGSKRQLMKTTVGVMCRRVVAAVLDMNMMLFLVFMLSFSAVASPAILDNVALVVALETAVIFAYKAVPEAMERKTLGKIVSGIEVKGDAWQALLRNATFILFGISMLPDVIMSPWAGIIYLIILADLIMFFTGRRAFDIISGTTIGLSGEFSVKMIGKPRIKFTVSQTP